MQMKRKRHALFNNASIIFNGGHIISPMYVPNVRQFVSVCYLLKRFMYDSCYLKNGYLKYPFKGVFRYQCWGSQESTVSYLLDYDLIIVRLRLKIEFGVRDQI